MRSWHVVQEIFVKMKCKNEIVSVEDEIITPLVYYK